MADDLMRVSASQFSTSEDCRRKWWLERVARLPEKPKGYLTFGTVLHSCLERWCAADANGRVPVGVGGLLVGQKIGDPVEVFPAGWETVEENGQKQTVTPKEAALIRKLVEQAVERGIVQRGDGRIGEREMRVALVEGIELLGYIDVTIPATENELAELHDHKSFGEGSVRYLKRADPDSPNYIGEDQQLLTYAAALALETGTVAPVVVRHNQFPKFDDGRGPREVHATVPPERIVEHMEWMVERALELRRIRSIERWQDVPGPRPDQDSCNKYGGCPFRDICGGRSTLDQFRARMNSEAASTPLRLDLIFGETPTRKTENMGDIFARPARSAAPAAAPAPAISAAPQPINGGVAAAPAPAAPMNAPPWADPACSACKGVGFNSKGRTCPMCDAVAPKSGRPRSGMYLISGDLQSGFKAEIRPESLADAVVKGYPEGWSSLGGAVAVTAPSVEALRAPTPVPHPAAVLPVVLPAPALPAPVAATPPTATTITGSTPAAPAAPAPVPEVASAPAPEAAAAEEKARKGRKPVLTVMLGCVQVKGPQRETILIQELLERLGAELAKGMGATSYWELDPFKRRDRLRQRAAEIAESLGTATLIVPGGADPDSASLAAALLPLAQFVMEGTR